MLIVFQRMIVILEDALLHYIPLKLVIVGNHQDVLFLHMHMRKMTENLEKQVLSTSPPHYGLVLSFLSNTKQGKFVSLSLW